MNSWKKFKKIFSKNHSDVQQKKSIHEFVNPSQSEGTSSSSSQSEMVRLIQPNDTSDIDIPLIRFETPPIYRHVSLNQTALQKTADSDDERLKSSKPLIPFSVGPSLSILPDILAPLKAFEDDYMEDDPEIVAIFGDKEEVQTHPITLTEFMEQEKMSDMVPSARRNVNENKGLLVLNLQNSHGEASTSIQSWISNVASIV